MGTTFKIKNIKGVKDSVNKRIKDAIYDAKVYDEAHLTLKEDIQSGRNPRTGRNYRRLKDSTIANRRYLARHNTPDSAYQLRLANNTLTGETLNGLFTEFDKNTGEITIDITGTHPGYQGASGQVKEQMPKEVIAEYLAEQGRPILYLSKRLLKEIIDRINNALKRL